MALPSRRGIAPSRAGKAAQFVDQFLRALQERCLSWPKGLALLCHGWAKTGTTYVYTWNPFDLCCDSQKEAMFLGGVWSVLGGQAL